MGTWAPTDADWHHERAAKVGESGSLDIPEAAAAQAKGCQPLPGTCAGVSGTRPCLVKSVLLTKPLARFPEHLYIARTNDGIVDAGVIFIPPKDSANPVAVI